MIKLEVCCDSLDSVQAAVRGGASRIELCSALTEGGLTPAIGMVREALRLSPLPIHVLIRPRGGDFLYSSAEWQAMRDDVAAMRDLGAHGVVIGGLLADGRIDVDHTAQLVAEAGLLSVTFHRALDMSSDPEAGIASLCEIGIHRLLTSGTAATALEGGARIAQWQQQFGQRIILMPGCGVNSKNVAEVIRQTGATEIHASAKQLVKSGMTFRRDDVKMGSADRDEFARYVTDEAEVRKIRSALTALV